MRYLGIDFGLKRVGLAVTDPAGKLAFPLKTIYRTTRARFFEELLRIIETEGVQAIVLGMPLALEGGGTLTARQVENFRQSLMRSSGLPVHLVNEALTSFEGKNILRQHKVLGQKQRQALDQLAAVLILETFLAQKDAEQAEKK